MLVREDTSYCAEVSSVVEAAQPWSGPNGEITNLPLVRTQGRTAAVPSGWKSACDVAGVGPQTGHQSSIYPRDPPGSASPRAIKSVTDIIVREGRGIMGNDNQDKVLRVLIAD